MNAEPSTVQPSLLGRTILVIEDHRDSREMLAMWFRATGARVFAVDTLGEAQRRFDGYKPDLVVCDLKLPDGTGLEFLVWLRSRPRARGRDVPCIALTGFDRYLAEARAIGFDAFMRKPADLAKLCNTAAALLARAAGS